MWEGFDRRLHQSKFAHNPMLLQGSIERFHLTYLTEGWIDLKLGKKIATRLSKLQRQQAVLKIPSSLLEERIFSTVKYRNVEWEKYLSSLGSKKEIMTHFSKWQERLHAYAQVIEKCIPILYLDTKEQNWDAFGKNLLRFDNKWLKIYLYILKINLTNFLKKKASRPWMITLKGFYDMLIA
ncbi:MAG: hypothetical protein C5B45_00510 [Chlamydiae bacterium]|nr:MAG: hypothetical protein C5B45_00510 [Chlamydiota bacterium]